MALTPGTRLGVYEITAPLGEGGMGQVWRARDTKLDRDVAIKVLPEAFAHDADRLARFTREARTLAALNHPNIAAIHGLEESSPSTSSGQVGVTALVMELVEGEDLSQRIARGAIPLDEAIPIAKQIAEALEAAHEQGIIHRDLKPANIKVRADGTVKVLDFGLAKALDPAAASSPASMNSPTITSPAMTQAGMILGTAAYMAPEQARGTAVDKRADVWAFGVVLFEMLTGQRLFAGATVSDTLAAVLKTEPDWTTLPAGTPTPLRRLLRRCLEKDRKRRLDSAAAARLEIDDALTPSPTADGASASGASASTASSRGRLPWMVATVAAAGMAALAFPALRDLRRTPPPAPPEMRVEITTPATDAPLQFALSPDGRALVFVASGDGPSRLWLRPLDMSEARPLAGTEGASHPFWSPDSRSVGFFSGSRLRRVDVGGGTPLELTAVGNPTAQGTWSAEGTILFAHSGGAPVWRIADTGGQPAAVTQIDPPRQSGHRAPQFLPDGRHFLFYALGSSEHGGIYLASLDGGTPTRLTPADSGGSFYPPDRILFVRQGALLTRRLDLGTRALVGEPETLTDRVGLEGLGRGGFAVSGAGVIAYRAGEGRAARVLTWVDRSGKPIGPAAEPDADAPASPAISPDGRRLAMWRGVQGNADIWLLNLVAGGLTRLTFDAAIETSPVWSPDGSRIAFSSNRAGSYDLYVKHSNGSAPETPLLTSANAKTPADWSRDGRWLLFGENGSTTNSDVWALEVDRPQERARAVANTQAREALAQLSPDGRWVAYQTDESGRFEVVVQSFPDAAGKWQISTAGGTSPRWRTDGRELYFLTGEATMMAASISAAGESFEFGPPRPLFAARIVGGGLDRQYAVSRDGRFLINQPVVNTVAAPITLILNWNPEATKER